MRESRLRNNCLGTPPLYFIQDVKRRHVTSTVKFHKIRPGSRYLYRVLAKRPARDQRHLAGRGRVFPGHLLRAGRERRRPQNPYAIFFRFQAEVSARLKQILREIIWRIAAPLVLVPDVTNSQILE